MSAQPLHWQEKRAALVIAHPGHELRVHGWLEKAKPLTLVLTDGSVRSSPSRLPSTTKILEKTVAKIGGIYGRFTDEEIYAAILRGDSEVFTSLLREMTDILLAGEIDYVAGDALEGYHPSHEICRYLIGAACELANRRSGRAIKNFDFLLTGRPDDCSPDARERAIRVDLDEAAVARKLAAAEGYPELKHEVDAALERFGKQLFATEWLRPVANREGLHATPVEAPSYEVRGENQKAAGHYQNVIRFQEHLLPLAKALWSVVENETR